MKTMPDWASAMVGNWRRIADLPETVSNDAIFTIVERESLHISSSTPELEAQETVAYLRQELGV